MIIMDTPYRLKKLLSELSETLLGRKIILGVELSKENENFLYGSSKDVLKKLEKLDIGFKLEFMLLVEGDEKVVKGKPSSRSDVRSASTKRTSHRSQHKKRRK